MFFAEIVQRGGILCQNIQKAYDTRRHFLSANLGGCKVEIPKGGTRELSNGGIGEMLNTSHKSTATPNSVRNMIISGCMYRSVSPYQGQYMLSENAAVSAV